MNAFASSTSSIAIDLSTGPALSAVIIPFRKAESRAEPEPVIEAAEPEIEAVEIVAGNDNSQDSEDEPESIAAPIQVAFVPHNALIERAPLARAFEIVHEAVETRNHIPILGNARMVADGNNINIIGTDLDIEIVASIPAAIDQGFDVTLPAKRMKDLLKGAPKADYVSFEDRDGFVRTDFEKIHYDLHSLPASDFPTLAAPADAATFRLPGLDLLLALEAVAGAISTEETRYYLNGIFIHVYDTGDRQELRLAATDGHRLYLQKLAMPAIDGGFAHGVILPRNAVATLMKLMKGKKCPEHVEIELAETKSRYVFEFEFGTITVTTKHIDGTFPDYARVMPSYANYPAARFDVDVMSEAIKACSLISSERGRAFKLSVSTEGAALDVRNPDSGSAHADVACEWLSDAVAIGFNAGYMLDALKVAGDGKASIHICDSGSPVTVIGAREGWLAVLMPMRV